MTPESWIYALVGGALIGGASLLAAALTGKIPGISGVFAKAIFPQGDAMWRWCFMFGLIGGAALLFQLSPAAATYSPVKPLWIHAIAGLLVGFGTRCGGGCSSGHGVCGIGLGAKDSLVATLVFMAAAMVTVYLT